MKVKKLIEALSECDPNSEVILQKDPEGNGYSPLEGADNEAICVEDGREYQVYDTKWSAGDACMDEAEWKQLMRRKRCVVLFPRH